MGDSLHYRGDNSPKITIFTLLIICLLSIFAIFQWDISILLENSFSKFKYSVMPMELILIWRFICVIMGLYAVYYMLNMGPGIMPVIIHNECKEKIIHPDGVEKFVTFSSWNLLINILYFSFAGIVSLLYLIEVNIPLWLGKSTVIIYSAALGTSFLTATVVRYVVIPGEVISGRNHEHLFRFHQQVMHNFAAIFLGIELIIIQPELYAQFSLFGLGIGLIYIVFAYLFAFYGGGYYAYSFIDPRLRNGPLFMSGLAGAIALFYLGIWLVSKLISYNLLFGSLFLILWLMMIVQFRPNSIN